MISAPNNFHEIFLSLKTLKTRNPSATKIKIVQNQEGNPIEILREISSLDIEEIPFMAAASRSIKAANKQ